MSHYYLLFISSIRIVRIWGGYISIFADPEEYPTSSIFLFYNIVFPVRQDGFFNVIHHIVCCDSYNYFLSSWYRCNVQSALAETNINFINFENLPHSVSFNYKEIWIFMLWSILVFMNQSLTQKN